MPCEAPSDSPLIESIRNNGTAFISGIAISQLPKTHIRQVQIVANMQEHGGKKHDKILGRGYGPRLFQAY